MKIAIIGVGAMGTLYGAYLGAGGLDVTLIDYREARAKMLAEQGIHVDGVRGEHNIKLPVVCDASEVGPCDLVLVLVKAYATEEAVRQHSALIGDDTAVVTLQNGIGNIEKIAAVVGEQRTLGGSITVGANLLAPGKVMHAGEGDTLIGELDGSNSERVERIVAAFKQAGFRATVSNDIKTSIWTKLVINAAVNPLTALLGVKNGVLAEREHSQKLMKQVVEETAAVAQATDNITLNAEALFKRVVEVCRLTAANKSSMLMDVLGQRRTEIDAINGAICDFAVNNGVTAPVNGSLAALVRTLESTYDLRQF